MARITFAGESLIAQKQGAKEVLQITRFIYANVPGLDANAPIDRAAVKPPANQIVHTYDIPPGNSGYVNPNQVVYSSMLGSDIGDFDWNWLGLESAEGVLFAVAYLPLQQKRRNVPPQQIGNNVTRNILVEYNGAQALTGITIDASTWQHDFTVRLAGIDERERLSNRDVYGRACFIGSAFQLEKTGSAYQLKAGQAYLEGIRIVCAEPTPVTLPALPTKAWLDVALQRQGNDRVLVANVVFGTNEADYIDTASTHHYLIPLADIPNTTEITDLRAVEPISMPLVKAFATVPALQQVASKVNELVVGTTPAGKAKQLSMPRNIAISGAGTGSTLFDGSQNVTIPLTLADSGVKAGTYAKVQINEKGLVVGAQSLAAGDIPALDWGKITSGKPTTLAGYGITDALHTGLTDQVPRFYAPNPGTDYTTVPVEIREAQMVGQAQKGFEYAPRLGFHWTKVASGSLAMDASGVLAWNGNRIWDSSSFNPDNKADRANTYTKTQVDSALSKKADNAYMVAELEKRLLINTVSQQRPRLSSPTNTGNWDSTALEIREVQQVGEWDPAQVGEQWAPGIAFHWAGKFGGKLYMDVAGVLKWQGRPLATLDSPHFTGTPWTDTAPAGDESGRLANTAFVQSTARNTALLTLGMGQSWQDVKVWRALNTTYTNSTGRPIAVTVTGNIAAGVSLTAVVNGVVAAMHYTNAGYATPPFLFFIVPPGQTYSVNGTGAIAISAWTELR